jgi:hypothetical protein
MVIALVPDHWGSRFIMKGSATMVGHRLAYAVLSGVYAALTWVSIVEHRPSHALCAIGVALVYAALSRRG